MPDLNNLEDDVLSDQVVKKKPGENAHPALKFFSAEVNLAALFCGFIPR